MLLQVYQILCIFSITTCFILLYNLVCCKLALKFVFLYQQNNVGNNRNFYIASSQRSAPRGLSPGRGLALPHGYLHPRKYRQLKGTGMHLTSTWLPRWRPSHLSSLNLIYNDISFDPVLLFLSRPII